jgi:protein involved in polysaccharide export with SLBB domain
LLTVSIWGATDLMMELPVGADGNLIVPSVGVLPVSGTTLAAANEALREACRGPYPRSEVSLTLAQPALLRIPVTGMVADPGSWEVLSTSRVSDVLQMAGGLREDADSRQVEIRRGGDAVLRCDLLAYLADGAADENPMLRSGDRVYVPPAENVVRVRGILSSAPGEQIRPSSPLDRPFEPQTRMVPLRGEDHLDFVIRAAGGPGRAFCDEGVWVQRGDTTAVWVERAGWPRFAMSPGDVVDVPFCREWVAVVGEVVRPGLYPFLPGETVADYVFAAGGPSRFGRGDGWSIVERSGEERSAAPGDTVAAGMHIHVPQRRMRSVSEFIAPVASLLALTISLVALFR